MARVSGFFVADSAFGTLCSWNVRRMSANRNVNSEKSSIGQPFCRVFQMFKRFFKRAPPPLTETPWRKYSILKDGWLDTDNQKLKEEISSICGEDDINVVFIGPLSGGKSSTINSYFTIMKDRIACRSQAGSDTDSFTTHYVQIPGEPPFEKITFYDSMGIEEDIDTGLTTENVRNIARGAIVPGSSFRTSSEETNKATTLTPSQELRIHCIVYVLDGENIFNGLKEGFRDKLTAATRNLKVLHKAPNRVVLLTRMDRVCEAVGKDISQIFHSRKVEQTVKRASEVTGIPPNSIFPVQNYVSEIEVDSKLNVPLLVALKTIVSFAKDNLTGLKKDDKLMSQIMEETNSK